LSRKLAKTKVYPAPKSVTRLRDDVVYCLKPVFGQSNFKLAGLRNILFKEESLLPRKIGKRRRVEE